MSALETAARPLGRGAAATAAVLALPALTAVGAVLRLWRPDQQSLRLDEAQSLHIAALPLWAAHGGAYVSTPSLFQAAAAEVHPPGYLLLLHFWISAFGTSPAVLRLPSELAGLNCVPALFLLASTLYGRRVALIATVLGALSPFWVWYAQETRTYSFLLLFSILSTWGLVDALARGGGLGWAVFTLATIAGVYTDYFAFLVLGAQCVFVIATARRFGAVRAVAIVPALAVVALAYVPWVAMLAANYRGAVDPELTMPGIYTPLNILSEFLVGYLSVPVTSQVVAAWPLLVLLGLVVSPLGAPPTWRGILLWTLLLVPAAISFGASFLVRPLVSERYLIIVTPALYVLVAASITHLSSRWIRPALLVATVPALLVALGVQQTSPSNPAAEDYRDVAGYIDAHGAPGDAVLLDAPANQFPYLYYARTSLPAYTLSQPRPGPNGRVRPMSRAALRRQLAGIEAGRRRLWVVYYLDETPNGTDGVRRYLDYDSRTKHVVFGGPFGRRQPSHPESYRNVQLVLYQVPNRPASGDQARPETVQDQLALRGASQSLRAPFGPAFSGPGTSYREEGRGLPPPRPAQRWYFTALAAGPAQPSVMLWNPNGTAAQVELRAHADQGDVVRDEQLAPHSEREVQLAAWDSRATGSGISVAGSLPIVASRTVIAGGQRRVTYGSTTPVPADGPVQVSVAGEAAVSAAHPELPCGDNVWVWTGGLSAQSGPLTLRLFLASGTETALTGTWHYDVQRGGDQPIASLPGRALGTGEYELEVTHPPAGPGQPAVARHVYFGVTCAATGP